MAEPSGAPTASKEFSAAIKMPFANGMASKLLTYALGRGIESFDRPAVNQIVDRVRAADYRMSSLVLEIVNSFPFQMQRGAGAQ
jgi:hypothetical protein